MKRWYVIHSKASKEAVAEANLKNQGYETYLPRYRKERRHARKVDTVLAPLFPRYLFVCVDIEVERWLAINNTIGVSHVLCEGSRPMPVPEGVVQAIRGREGEDGCLKLELAHFKKDQLLRVLDGPFEDMVGLFAEQQDTNRVVLLLDLLGREVKVHVETQSVVAA
ncbi:MAG: transcriptional activator RfaH [Rhodospirillales bacterium]|nr:transcriptional activator RfaH [Rhodospirillales bacterium]